MSGKDKTTSSKVKGSVPEKDLELSRAFEFGEEDSGLSFDPQDQDPRSPVGTVVSGALEGFYSTVTDQEFIMDRVKDALPDSFNETLKSVDVVTRSMSQLYDDSVKDLKPQLSGIARKIDRLVPENQKFLKSITSKFADWTGGNQQSFKASSKEEMEEKTIQDSLGQLFKAQVGVQTDLAARASAEKQIDREIDKKKFSASMDISTESYRLLSRISGYTEGINQSFQKKSLEIQFRQLFATRELLRMTKESSEASFKQREAMVKNTGLPDFVKIHKFEMLKEQSIRRLINNAQQAMFGDQDPLTAALGRLTTNAKSAVQGFKAGVLNPAKEAADMVASQFEEGGMMGGDKNENLKNTGGIIGTTVGGHVGDYAREKIKKYREKIPGYELLERFGTMAKTDMANPAVLKERFFGNKEIQDFIDKRGLDDDSFVMKTINGVFDILGEKFKPQVALQGGHTGIDLLEANDSGFSRRSDQTLNVVLPGYLSRILREVASIRAGGPVDLTIFDHNSGDFKLSSVMAADIKKNLVSKFAASSTKRDVNDAYEALFKDENLSEEDKVKAKKFILGLSRENIGYTSKGITESESFQKLTTEDQVKYREIVEKRLGEGNDVDNKAYSEITTRIRSAQRSQPNAFKDIQTELSLGRGPELLQAGLVRRNSRGEYEMVIDEVLDLMDKQATEADPPPPAPGTPPSPTPPESPSAGGSDINLKRNIKKFNPRDAMRSIRNTAVAAWNYRKDRYGEGSSKATAIGPMAQDVRAHMGDEAAPEGNKIDLITMNGVTMGAVKDLDQRLIGYEKKQEALRIGYDPKTSPLSIGYTPVPSPLAIGYDPKTTIEEETPPGKAEEPKSRFEQLVSDIKGDTLQMVELLSKVAMFGFFNFSELADFDYEKNKEKLKEMFTVKKAEAMSAGEHMLAGIKKFGKSTGDKFKRPFNFVRDKLNKLKDIPGKAYSWGKKKITDNWDTIKDLGKRGVKSAWDNTTAAVKYGVEAVPKVFRATIDTGKSARMFMKKQFDTKITDVYMAGEKEPRLRANLMRNGFYFDQQTGKVILDWTDIKGTIVDEKKNIIVSAEEVAKGLFDVDGKPLELPSIKAIKGMFALGGKLIKGTKDLVVKGASKAFEIAKLIGEKAKDINISSKFGFPGFEGMSLVSKKTHNVLVQIRDMIAKKFGYELPPDEQDDGKESKVEKATKTIAKWKDKIKQAKPKPGESVFMQQWLSAKDKVKNFFSKKNPKIDKDYEDVEFRDKPNSPQGKKSFLERAKEAAKNKAKKLASKIPGSKYKDESEGLTHITPIKPERKGGAFERFDKFKEELKNRVTKKSGVSTEARYQDSSKSLFNKLGSLFSSNKKEQDTVDEANPEKKKKGRFGTLLDKGKEALKDAVTGKSKNKDGVTDVTDKSKEPKTPDGKPERKGGAFERFRQMQEEIKNRVTKKSGVSTELRYQDTSNSFLSKAMGMISGVADWFKDKLGGLFGTIGSMALGGLGKGLLGAAGVIGKGVTTVGGALFKGAGALFRGQAASLGARGVMGIAARTAATAALSMGGPLLAMGSMALSGAMAVISSPVVLGAAAVALAGYGAYKSYKYLTRNNTDKWQKIRLKQYGLNDSSRDSSHYHKLMEVEDLLTETALQFKNNQAVLGTALDFDKVVSIFGIDKTNEEKLESLLKWFNGRFKPFYLTHQTAIYNLNRKYRLNNIEDMTVEDKIKYLDVMAFPDGPYGVTDSPFSDIEELGTDQSDVLTSIENIKKELRQQKSDKKFKEVPKAAVDKAEPKQAKPATPNANEVASVSTQKPDNASSSIRNAMKNGTPVGGDGTNTAAEDGKKPPETTSTSESQTGAAPAGGFKVAAGPIADSGAGMQFIKVGKDTSLNGLNPAFLKHLSGMAQEYGQITGKSINVNEGFRTYEQQAALYAKYPHKAAKPGRSLHEKGLAVDISSVQLAELDKLGLMRKYGITRPVGGETWHAEPIGIQLNIDRARKDGVFAQQAIEGGLFKGGGGAGANPKVPFGKRSMADVHAALYGAGATVNNKPLNEGEVGLAGKAMGITNDAINKASASSKEQVSGPAPVGPSKEPTASPSTPTPGTQARQEIKQGTQNQPTSAVAISDDAGKLMSTNVVAANKNIDALKGMGAINPQSKEDVMRAIDKAAQMTSTDSATLKTFAALESGFKANAAAKTSSAKGLFQFIDGTWKQMLSKHGPKYGLDNSAKQTDPMASALMAGEYIKTNMNIVSKVKPDVNIVDAYLAHFLGAGGARSMLSANPNEIASKVNPKAASANYNMFNSNGKLLTVGEFYDKIRTKIINKAQEYGISLPNNIFNKTSSGARPDSYVAPLVTPNVAPAQAPTPAAPTAAAPASPRPSANIAPPVDPVSPNAQQASASTTTKPASNYANLEDLGSKQLTALQAMVKLLESIDGKIDPQKFAELANSLKGETQPKSDVEPSQPKRPGNNMIDDRRYKPSVDIRRA